MVVYTDEKASLTGWRSQAVRRPVDLFPARHTLRGAEYSLSSAPKGWNKINRALKIYQLLGFGPTNTKPHEVDSCGKATRGAK